jgi:alpha-ketoglutaric semialdehyde dehydrogenase
VPLCCRAPGALCPVIVVHGKMTFMPETFRNLIGGEWVAARSGRTFENVNPADTTDIVGLFQQSDAADTKEAIAAAKAAQPIWAAVPAPKRGEILHRAALLLESRADQVAREMTREEGKTLPEARGEVGRAINILRYFGGEGARLGGQHAPSERERVFIQTTRKPLGVVGLITPWNFPIAIPAWKTAPALIAGNAVVLKPSDLAPLCALRLVEVLSEAGVAKGALNLVTGPGSKVGNEIVTNPDVKAISFTGSEPTGAAIALEAAKRRARVQLEMGGKNPTIVLADADIPDAVNVVVNAAFFSTGQRCTATSRVIVEEPVVDRFTAALVERTRALRVGNGLEAGTEIGPSIDERQLSTVLEYVGVGTGEGARLLCGGDRLTTGPHARGYFSAPAVLTDVAPQMRVAQEEIFGPVLSILPAHDLNHAIEIANGIRFGLSAAICTRSLTAAYEFINRIEAGLVMVNLPSAGVEYHVPFGGSKASSLGMREQGPVAVAFYSQIQTAYIKY